MQDHELIYPVYAGACTYLLSWLPFMVQQQREEWYRDPRRKEASFRGSPPKADQCFTVAVLPLSPWLYSSLWIAYREQLSKNTWSCYTWWLFFVAQLDALHEACRIQVCCMIKQSLPEYVVSLLGLQHGKYALCFCASFYWIFTHASTAITYICNSTNTQKFIQYSNKNNPNQR